MFEWFVLMIMVELDLCNECSEFVGCAHNFIYIEGLGIRDKKINILKYTFTPNFLRIFACTEVADIGRRRQTALEDRKEDTREKEPNYLFPYPLYFKPLMKL